MIRRFSVLLVLTSPAAAQGVGQPAPTVEDVITRPLADVNLKRREMPPELIAIRDHPYAAEALTSCAAIGAEIEKLNTALGPDFDEVEVDEASRKRKEDVANAAGGLVSSLIPFRSLVREISGAGRADRDYREALYAGVVRRGYLKGLGQARNCPAPARPLHPLEGAAGAAGQAIRGGDDK
ncbi:MAG: hypothetical protein ACKOPR_01680 [Chakrabartia godavariana]